MQLYRDFDGNSGIEAYEIGFRYIIMKFKKGKTQYYKYTVASAGIDHFTTMQKLAEQGEGLNTYIKDHTINYESKW